jgi:hypothetical protein
MKNKQRIYYFGVQQDERWHRLRNGLFTSSDIYIIMNEPKTKKQKEQCYFSKAGVDFIDSKANDIIYNSPIVFGGSAATDWGNDYEPEASKNFKEKYLLFQDSGLKKLSFVELLNEGTGTSPDDTFEKLIPVEYKCPANRNNHRKHIRIKNQEDLKIFSKKFYFQIMHQMFVLGSENGFWCSYDPRMKELPKFSHNALHRVEIKMDSETFDLFSDRIPRAVELRDSCIKEMEANE